MLAAEADEKVCNIVHLIYNAKNYEGIAKDYEFSRRTMEEHWAAGYEDVGRAASPSGGHASVPTSWKAFAPSTGPPRAEITADRRAARPTADEVS